MRLTEIANGARLTLFHGKDAERKPMLVTVLTHRLVRSRGKLRVRLLVKPCNGGRTLLVVPRQLQPASVYDEVRNRIAVIARRARRLEEQRLAVHRLLMRRGIVPQQAELVDGGHAFTMTINSRDLGVLEKLLRGTDGNETTSKGEGTDQQGEGEGTAPEDATSQLQGQVPGLAAASG